MEAEIAEWPERASNKRKNEKKKNIFFWMRREKQNKKKIWIENIFKEMRLSNVDDFFWEYK